MPPKLKKKIGPLAVWQWAAIVAGIVGLYLYQQRKAAAAAGPGYSPADYGQIDPNTGVPYALEGTGSGAFGPIDPNSGVPYAFETQQGGPAPTAAQQIADISKLIAALRKAGLLPPARHPHHHRSTVDRLRSQLRKLQQRRARTTNRHKRNQLTRQIRVLRHQIQGLTRHHPPATSTGAGASRALPHNAAPHPRMRILQGGAEGPAPSHQVAGKGGPPSPHPPKHRHPQHAGGDLQMQRAARRRRPVNR